MIRQEDLLAFNFYKKEKFTGSFCGMRYLIEKKETDGEDHFSVTTWPGPYNYANTAEDQRTVRLFPFTADALVEIAAYLNEVYASGTGTWTTKIF